MRLTDASVAIRPRSPWEAMDLGVLLAREHRRLLMGSWAIVTLPIFTLLSLLLWDYPFIAILLFWWLKPAYERLPLLILSQALFGSTPTLKAALIAWPRSLKTGLLPSLTWRRLSLSRSFQLPVQQLESLSGDIYSQRIAVLSQKDMFAARSLTLLGSALELCLWVGLLFLFYALLPQQMELNWHWSRLLDVDTGWNWLEHLTNAFYALVLVIWGPVYVACGFTLYINRRTALEAWDIELVLRRLRQRLAGSAYALLIGIGLSLATLAPPSWAAEESFSCPAPDRPALQEAGPDHPRLTHQTLSSSAAREEINALLQQPPFSNPKIVTKWRQAEKSQDASAEQSVKKPGAWLEWLNGLSEIGKGAARFFNVLLWALAFALLCLIAWKYRAWSSLFVSQRRGRKKHLRAQPEQLFGLQVNAESLPDDVAGNAERLWASQPREALSLLYRALLSRLLHDYQLPLKNADTEGQVLEQIARLNQPTLHDFSCRLTTHWQNLAYGHQAPPADSRQELCDGWRRLFATGGQP